VNRLYLGVLVAIEFVVMAAPIILAMMPCSATWLHPQLLDTIENVLFYFFAPTDAGQIVNRFSQDLSVIDSELPIAG
jgi:ATP-binding cassette, subfamily C (CFTR/MRP), member 1